MLTNGQFLFPMRVHDVREATALTLPMTLALAPRICPPPPKAPEPNPAIRPDTPSNPA